MTEMGTDLVVLEGMGRAIHTNLYAKFNCESLKLAIVKNEWLAQSLGGSLFSVVCKYEAPGLWGGREYEAGGRWRCYLHILFVSPHHTSLINPTKEYNCE